MLKEQKEEKIDIIYSLTLIGGFEGILEQYRPHEWLFESVKPSRRIPTRTVEKNENDSSVKMHIRNTSDIAPKWKDI